MSNDALRRVFGRIPVRKCAGSSAIFTSCWNDPSISFSIRHSQVILPLRMWLHIYIYFKPNSLLHKNAKSYLFHHVFSVFVCVFVFVWVSYPISIFEQLDCTSPTHHRHTHPLDTPSNTHTTHLPSSRRNLGIKTPIHKTQIWQTYELDTNQTPRHTQIQRHTHIYSRHTPHAWQKNTGTTNHVYHTDTTTGTSYFSSPYRQNTTCSRTRSYSHDDGHNDARNMLR